MKTLKLAKVFKIDPSQVESQRNVDSLIDIFHSREEATLNGSNNV